MTKETQRKTLLKLAPYITLLVLIVIFFNKVTIFNQNFFWRDIFAHSYPAKKLFIEAIRSGEFPLWNPYIQLGVPYLADLSNQTLYFLNVIFFIPPSKLALNYFIIFHYLFCGLFTYLFVKDLTDNKHIGVFSGIAFSLCGYCVSLSCNLEYISAIAWLPAIFWALNRLLTTNKFIYVFLCSIFLSLLIFAGDPMTYYYTVGFLLIRFIFELSKQDSYRKPISYFILIVIFSLGISAIQLLPAFELTQISTRAGGLDFDKATMWSVNPVRLIEFLLPYYFGHHFPYPSYWGVFMFKNLFTDLPWAESFYIGIIPLFLALTSFFYRKTKEKYFWLTLIIISLILSLGFYTPIYKLLFNILPFFSSFRYPEKLILFVSFGICILAGLGLKDLIENKAEFSVNTRKYIIALLITLSFAYLYNISASVPLESTITSGLVTENMLKVQFQIKLIYFTMFFFALYFGWFLASNKENYTHKFLIFIITLTFFDLLFINSKAFITTKYDFFNTPVKIADYINNDWKENYPPRLLNTLFPDKQLSIDYLTDTSAKYAEDKRDYEYLSEFYSFIFRYYMNNLKPNRSLLFNIASINTTYPLKLKEVDDLLNKYQKENPTERLKAFNINYILETPNISKMYLKNDTTSTILKDDYYNEVLLKSNITPNRALILYNVLERTNNNEILKTFTDNSFNINKQAIILGKANKSTNYTQPSNKITATITKYTYNTVEISTNNQTNCLLLLFDSYYPGWKVLINNQESKIYKTNYLYRGVKLNKGNKKIKFIFDPITFKIGLTITLLFLIIGIFLSQTKFSKI